MNLENFRILEILHEKKDELATVKLCIVLMDEACLYKVVFRETIRGKDDTWLAPGEEERGYSFPMKEAQYVSNKHNLGFEFEFHTPR